MKVFISWSGSLSQSVASLLRKYLPCMLQGLDVFMSKHDLQSGSRWSSELSKELENSSFGIICLTSENRESAWILFEAGALSKHSEGRACCLLIGSLRPVDVSGPLAQFQNRSFGEDDFQVMLRDLNERLTEPLSEQHLALVFEKWWPDLDRDYTTALASGPIDSPNKRAESDILEEILLRLRNIEKAVEPEQSGLASKAIAASLELMWRRITDEQKELLYSLVDAVDYDVDPGSLAALYPARDLHALQQAGLVALNDEGGVRLHPLVAGFVRNNRS